jgi:hypothetical protein
MSYRWVRLSADKAMAFFVLGRASSLFCRILALWLARYSDLTEARHGTWQGGATNGYGFIQPSE